MFLYSVRRTASQWAISYDIDTKKLVDIGRWLDFNEVRKYVGQGGTAHQEAVENSLLMARILSVACGSFDQQSVRLLVENSTVLSCYS